MEPKGHKELDMTEQSRAEIQLMLFSNNVHKNCLYSEYPMYDKNY